MGGFSWGGGVLCWMIAEGTWAGPAVLLAPTVQKMRCVACFWPSLPRAAVEVQQARCHVFHANGDPFCPDAQLEMFTAAGFRVQRFNDSHMLDGHSALKAISESL